MSKSSSRADRKCGPQSLRGLQLAVRAAAGASIAFAIAEVLRLEHPIIAFTAAVIVTDLKPAQTRELGLRRVGATIVGAVTGAVLSPFLPTHRMGDRRKRSARHLDIPSVAGARRRKNRRVHLRPYSSRQ